MDEQTFRGCYQALAGTGDVDADAIDDDQLAAIPATRAELEEVDQFLRPLRHAFHQPGVDEQQARQDFVEPYWQHYSTGRPQSRVSNVGFAYPPTGEPVVVRVQGHRQESS